MEPEIYIPGKTRENPVPARDRSNTEYPKMVYTAGLVDHLVINSPEECPDGYYEHAIARDLEAEEKVDGDSTDPDAAREQLEAEKAKREAKKAEKEYRKELMAYLDAHDVEFARNLSTSKLEELKVALDEHLAAKKEASDDNQLDSDN